MNFAFNITITLANHPSRKGGGERTRQQTPMPAPHPHLLPTPHRAQSPPTGPRPAPPCPPCDGPRPASLLPSPPLRVRPGATPPFPPPLLHWVQGCSPLPIPTAWGLGPLHPLLSPRSRVGARSAVLALPPCSIAAFSREQGWGGKGGGVQGPPPRFVPADMGVLWLPPPVPNTLGAV